MDTKRKLALAMLGCAVAAFVGAWVSGYGVAVNTSISMPRGLYLVAPLGKPQRGEIVAVCIPAGPAASLYLQRDYLPASKACPSGLAAVLKPIAGVSGDVVKVEALATSINGVAVVNSGVFSTDSDGKPIQHLPVGWEKRLGPGEFFMLSNHIARSLDSRYYGPVQLVDLRGRAVPLITF